jgi:hypothetical protein
VGWDLDGRIGSVVIDGRERVGLAWVRDRARKRIVFHAMSPREASGGDPSRPPAAEEFEVDEVAFRPVFSVSWAKRRRGARLEPD